VRPDQPSRTALMVGIHRAAHQLLDAPPVLADPLALRILPPRAAAALQRDPRHFERGRPGALLRALLAARSRIAEETVAAAVARGVAQYVVLGAGLDTFAYRNPHPSLSVFEVDHPATQRFKLGRLAEAGIAVPPNVRHVPGDFERHDLAVILASGGVDATRPALFSWLGVVPYVEESAVWATLSIMARHAAGTAAPTQSSGAAVLGGGVVFDYGLPPRDLPLLPRFFLWRAARRVARAGEPWRTFLRPAAVRAGLADRGFTTVDDWSGAEVNRRYFAGRADGLRMAHSAHIVTALMPRGDGRAVAGEAALPGVGP
jgi:methyltransferase (TIGR00027 family)